MSDCGSLVAVRVLVTGASGFVGRALVPRLAEARFDPVGFDRELDVTDTAAIRAKIAELMPGAIIHLAAVSSVAESLESAAESYRVNLLGACNLLEAVRRHAPDCRLLLIGSGEAYGSAPQDAAAFSEESPLRPGSPYAQAKASADLLGAAYAENGLDVVRTRSFNHTGPGQSDQFVAASFARQIAEIESGQRPPRLQVGNLDSVRDFLDVDDVIDAYLRLLDPEVPANVYNVSSGVGLRIGDLLEQLLEHSDVRIETEQDPARTRPTDRAVGDPTRLRKATGWKARVPLSVTFERVLNDWRARVRAA